MQWIRNQLLVWVVGVVVLVVVGSGGHSPTSHMPIPENPETAPEAYAGITSNNPCVIPIYRYVSEIHEWRHFYTWNWGELGNGNSEWKYEGIGFYTAQTATCLVPNGVEVWRLRHPTLVKHVYGISQVEKDTLLNQGYILESRLGFVAPSNNPEYQTTEIFRLFRQSTNDHFLTRNLTEKDLSLQNGYVQLSNAGYGFEPGNIAPRKPTLQSPASGLVTTNKTQTFTWTNNGDPDRYPKTTPDTQLKIRQVGGSWQTTYPWQTSTSRAVTVPSAGQFCWAVQASDGELTSGWSAERCFTVNNPTATPTRTPTRTPTPTKTFTPTPTKTFTPTPVNPTPPPMTISPTLGSGPHWKVMLPKIKK